MRCIGGTIPQPGVVPNLWIWSLLSFLSLLIMGSSCAGKPSCYPLCNSSIRTQVQPFRALPSPFFRALPSPFRALPSPSGSYILSAPCAMTSPASEEGTEVVTPSVAQRSQHFEQLKPLATAALCNRKTPHTWVGKNTLVNVWKGYMNNSNQDYMLAPIQ